MLRFYASAFLFFSLRIGLYGQSTIVPEEAKPFVLKGYEVLDLGKGDINSDNLNDLVLILKNPAEDSLFDERSPRPLLLLVRQSNGKLKQVVRNDNAVMGRHDGGVFGDPWEGVNVFKGGFSLSFYGGSSWRWAYNYEFTWNAVKKNWMLTRESSSSFHSADVEKTMKEIEIGVLELGVVPIEKFNTEFGMEESTWKVIAAKTYFYDSPKLGSKPRKGYLVKGNTCTGIRQLKNFIQVNFDSGKGDITSGFLLKKDLVKITP
jgi:hypothetical protein